MQRQPVISLITAPPPLLFALVWNGFITVHAFVMLGAVWKTKPVMLLPLLAFYSIFFGVGFWMARITVRGYRLKQRYGSPVITAAPTAVTPGTTATVSLRFDRAWSLPHDVEATAHWATFSLKRGNGSATPPDARPASAQVSVGARGTDVSVMVLAPVLPGGMDPATAMLEVRLASPAGSTIGWRFQLPSATVGTGNSPVTGPDTIDLAKMSPGDRAKAVKVMGKMAGGLMFAAVVVVFLMARDGRLAFTDLIFPFFLGAGGWYLRKLTDFLQRTEVWSATDPQAVRDAFRHRVGGSLAIFPVVMVGAFAADILLPHDVIGTARQLMGMASPTIREEPPSQTLNLTPTSEQHPAASVEPAPVTASGPTLPANADTTLWNLLVAGRISEARELLHGHPERLDEEAKRMGESPVHMAAYTGNTAALTMLLDEGVDVNAVNHSRNGRGETLLMSAARSPRNSVDMIRLLLWRGARLNDKDDYGKNATDWAEFFGVPDASDELCAKGLEPTPLDRSPPNNEQRKRASCREPSAARR